jgi:NAD(P)-dependent dehydrogenase (short-subunit alcohol dehydrogenase family)
MPKKILVIGATGTIGKAIVQELQSDCTVIPVGNASGEDRVDITSTDSIIALYTKHKDVDAVVCAAARGVVFAPLCEIRIEDYVQSIQAKQLGQINLVIQGLRLLSSDVSFTLTTGLLNADPIVAGSAAGMVNGAIEGFVRAAAIDMPAQQRINVVSPTLLVESVEKYATLFAGYLPVPAATVALAYRKSIMGRQTGQVMRVGW